MTFASTATATTKANMTDQSSIMNIWHGFYEIHEDDKCFQISLGVPGIKEDHLLRIQVEDNRRALRITGYRKVENDNKTKEPMEGQPDAITDHSVLFTRRIFLGCKVSSRKLEANILNGVLYVKVSKKISNKDR